ncbi:unnamed protein product [Natator depressus]
MTPPPSCSGEFQALSNAEDQIQVLMPGCCRCRRQDVPRFRSSLVLPKDLCPLGAL